MSLGEAEQFPQVPGPDDGDSPRSERDPRRPTATGPDSVEESVYGEAEHAGQEGPDAADPPTAAGKREPEVGPDSRDVDPGADLDPDEAADVLETREEAHRIKQTRDDQRDEDIISLDTPD